jgi:hypothetical protein
VKHSQVAGLAAGWLAVALSMAAIGTAAVNRVGMGTAKAQVQVTVARSVTVGISGAVLAPAQAPSSEAATPSAVKGESGTHTVSLTQYALSAARTTSASANIPVPITVPLSTPASSSAAVPPVVAVPGSEALLPQDGTPTTTPTKAKPTKVTTPKKSTVINAATATADPSVVAVTFAAWSGPQGAIRAGCKGTQLAIVEPKPSDGYTASQRLALIRSSITFDGPEKLSVLVSCEDGLPRFSTMR